VWDVGMEVGHGYGPQERVCGSVGRKYGGGTWLWAMRTWTWGCGTWTWRWNVVMGQRNVGVGLWDLNMEMGCGYGSQERGCGAVGSEHRDGTWLWARGTWVWNVGMEVGRGYGPQERV